MKVLVYSTGLPRVSHVTIYVHRYIADVCQFIGESIIGYLTLTMNVLLLIEMNDEILIVS